MAFTTNNRFGSTSTSQSPFGFRNQSTSTPSSTNTSPSSKQTTETSTSTPTSKSENPIFIFPVAPIPATTNSSTNSSTTSSTSTVTTSTPTSSSIPTTPTTSTYGSTYTFGTPKSSLSKEEQDKRNSAKNNFIAYVDSIVDYFTQNKSNPNVTPSLVDTVIDRVHNIRNQLKQDATVTEIEEKRKEVVKVTQEVVLKLTKPN
eukprot:TRINITY_DN5315_c0_g1_i1.p1 TRINITY_DN5315_c0_g1~~TRINITY_DN5315_c0_g1_i1.p1  ORF type:complete len:202 (+),score=43.77 TRINITY_DN5315_c0_g1_i1:66-671(+)